MAVVDASIVVDWVAPHGDPRSPAAGVLRRLVETGEEIVAPALMLDEVANALLTGVRRRRWGGAEADAAHRRLRRLPARLTREERDRDRAWELSRRYDNHPIYDMLYLAVAERLGTVLITADEALRARVALPFVVGP